MKKAIVVSILAFILIVPLAVLAGCGGGKSDSGSLSEPAKLLDNALREMTKGNYKPLIQLVPPEMRGTMEQMYEEEPTSAVEQSIIEANYRTDEADSEHVIVYFWGTIEFVENGETRSESITEEEAQQFPMVKQDGEWYIDYGLQAPQESQQQ